DVDVDDYATCRELGHARVPAVCLATKKTHQIVDRSTGERPGLVDGDYVTCEFESKGDYRLVYTQVCLRGTKGMHLIELARERTKTWKFCFYQALVALLAKTQLRYKFATSNNIDYIYDLAWMLFLHVGSLSINHKLRLDDVVVYNYNYCVEMELVQELKDVEKDSGVGFRFLEKGVKIRAMKRPELMKLTGELGQEKKKLFLDKPVHEGTKEIEHWFDKLPDNCRNCVFRTEKFALAFWKDGSFWYLYNPYRCDKFGFWDDNGKASVIKFCSRVALRRHLMILLVRAYAYGVNRENVENKDENLASDEKNEENIKNTEEIRENDEKTLDNTNNLEIDKVNPENQEESTNNEENLYIKQRNQHHNSGNDKLTIQIFQLNYNCVKLHNLKLLCKNSSRPKTRPITKKVDEYDVSSNNLDSELVPSTEHIEKPSWLSENRITWSKVSSASPCRKARWHEYLVEEPRKLFSLWGEIHPTGRMFSPENRGKQIHACYLVCLGMSRIMAPEYWSSKTLDTVVMCGDRCYASSRLQSDAALGNSIDNNNQRNNADVDRARTSWESYLTRHFKIGDMLFEVKVLSAICGRLYSRNSLWKILQQMFLTHSYGVLTCESSCLAIFKFCGAYYVFDTNSFGPPIFDYGQGVAYLLRATSFQKLLKTLILIINSLESSRFSVNPVEILKIIDVESPCSKIKEKKLKKKLKRTKGCK
ncbi:GSCOCG00005675001-RA-CDS, partial [Cotesia congregata]